MQHLSELKPNQLPTLRTHPHMRSATVPLIVTVTDDDLVDAMLFNMEWCPLAKGARNNTPGVVDSRVIDSFSYLEFENGDLLKYRHPAPVTRTINRHDVQKGLFPPGDYRLEPPTQSDKVGARHRHSGPHHKKRTRKPRVVRAYPRWSRTKEAKTT